MQTIPLYHTTGISGFKITRIRTVANSGKTKTLEGQEDCQKGGGREAVSLRSSTSTPNRWLRASFLRDGKVVSGPIRFEAVATHRTVRAVFPHTALRVGPVTCHFRLR